MQRIMRGGFVALAFLLTVAQSNPPSPSGGESQGKRDDAGAEHHADTQRGIPAAPFVVEIRQPESQNAIARQTNEAGRRWYSRPDSWVAVFTALLFLATTALWVFTALLWRSTRDGLLAAQRPRLIIHFVKRIPASPDAEREEQSIAIRFRIMNTGTGDARVIGSRVRLHHYEPGQWPFPDDLVGADLFGDQRFKVGAAREERIETDEHGGQCEAVGVSGRLYLIGWIVYDSGIGRRRNPITTYFCREYDQATDRFIPAKNCDWEEQEGQPREV